MGDLEKQLRELEESIETANRTTGDQIQEEVKASTKSESPIALSMNHCLISAVVLLPAVAAAVLYFMKPKLILKKGSKKIDYVEFAKIVGGVAVVTLILCGGTYYMKNKN